MTGKTITRVELCEAVYRTGGLSRSQAVSLVEAVLGEITDTLVNGEPVKLSSFGTFTVRKKGPRMGRNPKTGIEVPISPRRVAAFKPSAIMKQQVNGSRPVTTKHAEMGSFPPAPEMVQSLPQRI